MGCHMKTHFCRLVIGTSAVILAVVGGISCKSHAQSQPPLQSPPPQAMDNPPDPNQAPADVLPPDIASNGPLVEVIHMSQAAVGEEVMVNYVKHSQYKFNLTSGQLIYLKDIGVPDSVTLAMINRDQELGGTVSVPPPQAAPAPPPTTTVVVNDDYFYDSLAPYGTWVYVEGYGRCWRPAVASSREWRPYCDGGHWIYTDNGWYWYSDYSWGWAPYHYGRWFYDGRFGWCWWPDTVWGPSWVTWRYSDDYCGWAPLPPHCYYREGVGLVYNGVTVSIGFDFGFGFAAFTFVDSRHFCDPHPWRYRANQTQVTQIYNHTTINNITVVNNGNNNTTVVNGGSRNTTIVNRGVPPEHIATVTHSPIRPVHIRETSTPVRRGELFDRDTLVVNRPHFGDNSSRRSADNGAGSGAGNHTIPSPTTGAPMQVPPPGHNRGNNNNTANDNDPNRRNPAPGLVNDPRPIPAVGQPVNPVAGQNDNGNRVMPGQNNNPQRREMPPGQVNRFTPRAPAANAGDNGGQSMPLQRAPAPNAMSGADQNQNNQNDNNLNRPNRNIPGRVVPNQTPPPDNRVGAPVPPPDQNQNPVFPHNQPSRSPVWDRPNDNQNDQPQPVAPIVQPRPQPQPQPQPQGNPNRTYNSPRSYQTQQPVYVQPAPQPAQPNYQPQDQSQGQGQGQGRGRDKDRNDR